MNRLLLVVLTVLSTFTFISVHATNILTTAIPVDSFLNCPIASDCISGSYSDYGNQAFDWNQVSSQWQDVDSEIDTQSGVWMTFTPIDDRIGINSCQEISESGALLLRFNRTDSNYHVHLSENLPVSRYGPPGLDLQSKYFLYLYPKDPTADSFSICIDNILECNNDYVQQEELCNSDLACGWQYVEGMCWSLQSAIPGPSRHFPLIHANTLDNPIWYMFTARNKFVELVIENFGCWSGSNVQVQLYKYDITLHHEYHCYNGLVNYLLPLHYVFEGISQGVQSTPTIELEPGQTYVLVVDGFSGAECDLEINFLPLSVEEEPEFINYPVSWYNHEFPFVADTVCVGSEDVVFEVQPQAHPAGYLWTINGTIVQDEYDRTTLSTDFLVAGDYNICVQAYNGCSASDVSCLQITAFDANLKKDTFRFELNCDSVITIYKDDYPAFTGNSSSYFLMPNGFRDYNDSLTISTPTTVVLRSMYCSDLITFIISEGYTISDSIWSDCHNLNVTLNTSGLVQPKFHWSNGVDSNLLAGVKAGWYTVTITDDLYQCEIIRAYKLEHLDSCYATVSGHIAGLDTLSCFLEGDTLQIENQQIQVLPSGQIFSTDKNGHYSIDLLPGNYTLKPLLKTGQIEICPDEIDIEVDHPGHNQYHDFLVADTTACRVSTKISSTFARPDEYVIFSLLLENHSSNVVEGNVSVLFDSSYIIQTIISENTSINSGTGHYVEWDAIELPPWSQEELIFRLKTDSSIIDGQKLENIIFVNYDCPDTLKFDQIVRTSFDPNTKSLNNIVSNDRHEIVRSDSVLTYLIQFQNTGNHFARDVRITDKLSDNLVIQTFVPGPSSHEYTWHIDENRVLEFQFDDIYLPYAAQNEEQSIGFVSFDIKVDDSFEIGDSILNFADIFFDFNVPVRTNTLSSNYIRPIYTHTIEVELCQSEEIFGVPIKSDTIIRMTKSFFDYDSVTIYDVHVIPPIRTHIDTLVHSGSIVAGAIIEADTMIIENFVRPQNGCDSIVVYDIKVLSGTDNYRKIQLSVHPNPFNQEVFISSNSPIYKVRIIGSKGDAAFSQHFEAYTQITLNTSQLSSGLYYLIITTDQGTVYRKVIKQSNN